MAKIYLASSWKNLSQPNYVLLLRKRGHEVYDFRHPVPGDNGFSWDQIDPEWKTWTSKQYIDALEHPLARDGFKKDHEAMVWADTCVLLLPSGRSAHTEAGWMAGQGKEVHVILGGDLEPDLMYKEFTAIHPYIGSVVDALEGR